MSNAFHIADYKTIMGFEPLVNQRLLPPTFPRYTKIREREEAWEYMETLMSRLNYICAVTELTNIHVILVTKPSCSAQ